MIKQPARRPYGIPEDAVLIRVAPYRTSLALVWRIEHRPVGQNVVVAVEYPTDLPFKEEIWWAVKRPQGDKAIETWKLLRKSE